MSPMDLFERVTEKMFKFKRQDFFKTNFASLMRIHVIRKYAPLNIPTIEMYSTLSKEK